MDWPARWTETTGTSTTGTSTTGTSTTVSAPGQGARKDFAWVDLFGIAPRVAWNGLAMTLDHRKEVACEVKENGRRKADRVDSIEYSGVPLDEGPGVGHAAIAFNCRHRHAAGKRHDRDDQ